MTAASARSPDAHPLDAIEDDPSVGRDIRRNKVSSKADATTEIICNVRNM